MADSAPPVSDAKDAWRLRLLGSDVLFWSALHVARGPLLRPLLATPPEPMAAAGADERTRVDDLADRILPVSRRAAGLLDDTGLGKRLGPSALEPKGCSCPGAESTGGGEGRPISPTMRWHM